MPDPDQPPEVQALQVLPPKDRTFVMTPCYIMPTGRDRWQTLPIPDATGFYAVVASMEDGRYWSGSAMEVFNPAHWAAYAIAATQIGTTGRWRFAVPFSVMPEGVYSIDQYAKTGDSPQSANPRCAKPEIVTSWNKIDHANFVDVDHNYGGPNSLRVVDRNGAGVSGASVTVYLKNDWISVGRLAEPACRTRTGGDGTWLSKLPILRNTDYAIVFHAPPALSDEAVFVRTAGA